MVATDLIQQCLVLALGIFSILTACAMVGNSDCPLGRLESKLGMLAHLTLLLVDSTQLFVLLLEILDFLKQLVCFLLVAQHFL